MYPLSASVASPNNSNRISSYNPKPTPTPRNLVSMPIPMIFNSENKCFNSSYFSVSESLVREKSFPTHLIAPEDKYLPY